MVLRAITATWKRLFRFQTSTHTPSTIPSNSTITSGIKSTSMFPTSPIKRATTKSCGDTVRPPIIRQPPNSI